MLLPDESHVGLRLDTFLAQMRPDATRSAWQKHIKSGGVRIDGRAVKANHIIRQADNIQIVGEPPKVEIKQLAADDIPILYEDEDVIVINKPAGLISHPKSGSHEASVSGSLLGRVHDQDIVRPGIVHRLDRDTSGVMIIAKHEAAKRALQAAFRARVVEKEYWALVWGEVGYGVQRITFSLSRSTKNATRMEVDPLGKQAQTYIQGLSRGSAATLIAARPTTGRTHQIRVHLAAIKHPIVGDPLYGDRSPTGHRLMLHAHSLQLPLPSGVKKTFIAEPDDIFLRTLDEFDCKIPVQ